MLDLNFIFLLLKNAGESKPVLALIAAFVFTLFIFFYLQLYDSKHW